MTGPSAHALLGASSAHRWLACPPSARLEAEHGEPDRGSEYAAQGTEAHALAELELGYRLGLLTKRQYTARMRKRRASPYHDDEMVEAVGDYASYVEGLRDAAAEETGEEPYVALEQRVDFSAYVPEGFGTADAVVIAGRDLHVVDLKYGKGVPVAAEGNPQLRLYALGAALLYASLYDVERVHMTIVQPRLNSVSTDGLALGELMRWAEETVAPAARAAWAGEGGYAPSEEACRWCRARSVCRARADAALAVASAEFSAADPPAPDELEAALAAPETLSDDETARLLGLVGLLEGWCKSVREHALARAEAGARYKGWKLVEGRATRRISDHEAAIERLEGAGVPAEGYLKPYELLGITALTKSLGSKRFSELLGDLVVKPAGKPVLVLESDKRPEIGSAESAAADFGE